MAILYFEQKKQDKLITMRGKAFFLLLGSWTETRIVVSDNLHYPLEISPNSEIETEMIPSHMCAKLLSKDNIRLSTLIDYGWAAIIKSCQNRTSSYDHWSMTNDQ